MAYTAKSLEDIAKAFEHCAWQATAFSDRLHKTKRDKMLAEREHQTWTRAAQMIRETTLELPVKALAGAVTELLDNRGRDYLHEDDREMLKETLLPVEQALEAAHPLACNAGKTNSRTWGAVVPR